MPLAEGATPATPADEGEPVQIVAALKAPNPAEDTAGDTAGVVQGADDAAAPDQAEVATSEGSGSKEAESAAGKKRSGEVPSARDPAEKAKSEAAPEPAKSDPSAGKPIQATDAKPEPAPHGALPGLHSAAGKAAPEMRAPDAPPQAPVAHQVPLGAVPIEIGLKSLSGINRFEIRLDPAELGRIDVRLDIDESGEVKAHLVVDRVETLALLQRDAKTLERAFEQAGLKPSEGGVDLSLRDPSGDGRQQGQARDERSGQQADRQDVATGPERAEVAPAPAKRIHWRSTGVDLRI
jgi:flagellar hook-length control protein FliK